MLSAPHAPSELVAEQELTEKQVPALRERLLERLRSLVCSAMRSSCFLVALALAYKNAGKAVRDHVDQENRQALVNLGGSILDPPLEHNDALQVFISESDVRGCQWCAPKGRGPGSSIY